MANQEHVTIVQEGPEAIRRWQDEHLHGILDLTGADLQGADLSRANLNRVDLSGAHLQGANLIGTYLQGADLSGADLQGANLATAQLGGANLRRAHLSGAHLGMADLSVAFMTEADLTGANLHRANLTEANLTGANLHRANLYEAHLGRAIMDLVRGAYQAHRLETTRFTPPTPTTIVIPLAPGQRFDLGRPSSMTTPVPVPSDRIHDAFYFETCVRPRPERWLDWEGLRGVGRLPLFGASYTALILIPILFYGLALYNDQVEVVRAWAEQVMTQPEHPLHRLASLVLARVHPRPIPQQSLLLLVSTILLAMGATLYTFFCPSRVKEFSRDQWCDQLGRSLLHYWPLAWRYRYIRLLCALCYALGGAGALWVIGTKVWRVLLFILTYSPYPAPWR
jgi:hypothetical protein